MQMYWTCKWNGATTFSIMTLNIMTFNIMTLSIKYLFVTLSIMTFSKKDTQDNEIAIILSVFMLSVAIYLLLC
jgi:hypothetical protein